MPQELNRHIGQWSAFADLATSLSCQTAFAGTEAEWKAYVAERGSWFTSGSQPRGDHTTQGIGGTVEVVASLHAGSATRPLIDLSSMTLNCVLGINDPWVKLRQVQFLLSPHPHFVTIRIGFDLFHRYARRVLRFIDGDGAAAAAGRRYSVNHRSCNGSDAVELAVQVAASASAASPHEEHRRRTKLMSFRGSYHGQNLTAALISEHQPTTFLVDRAHSNVELFDVPMHEDDAAAQTALRAISERSADFFAVIIEPVQARNAVHAVPAGFLRALAAACKQHSVCLIFDEVQTAFGYCGVATYAQVIDAWPDVFAFSKAVTSGHGALGLTVVDEPYKRFVDGTFCGKTNSADVLALVAADATLDRLCGTAGAGEEGCAAALALCPAELRDELKDGLLSHGQYSRAVEGLERLIADLTRDFPTLVAPVAPGFGLLRGLTMLDECGQPSTALCAWVCAEGLKHGVYVRQAEHTITLKPCLTFSHDEFAAARRGLEATFRAALAHRAACSSSS